MDAVYYYMKKKTCPAVVCILLFLSPWYSRAGQDLPGGTMDSLSSGQPDTVRARMNSDTVVVRSVPDSVISRWKRDKDFAYANDPAYWIREAPDPGPNNKFLRFLASLLKGNGFTYFIYLLLGSILCFAIYKIMSENNLRLFYRPPGKKAEEVMGEPGLLKEELDEEIQKAIGNLDFRLAVRYLYLKALNLLETEGLIHFETQGTNQEYIRQLSGKPQAESFRWLTRAYERVWYGEFSPEAGQFDKVFRYFQEFYQTISR
jgi:hypothetical protein